MANFRAISRIAPQTRTSKPLAPSQRFGLQQRINVANRLFGTNGAVPRTRLAEILNNPILTGRNMTEVIREILTFSRESHEATSEVISDVVREVEALSRDEVLAQAQEVVDRYYETKIAKSNDADLKTAFPLVPTIEEFAALDPNAHFDPFQLFASGTWGTVAMRIDYGRYSGFEKAMNNFDLRLHIRDALVMTRAFEII